MAGTKISAATDAATLNATDKLPIARSGLTTKLYIAGSYIATYVSGVMLAATNTWVGVQTFTNSALKLLGSSTGATTFTSDNAGATNYTLHVPAANDTLATLAGAEALSNKTITASTFSGTGITSTATAIKQKPVVANSSTAYTIDQANGAQFDITLNGATPVLTLQSVTASQAQMLYVTLIQDGTGGRVPSWTNVTWAAGVAPTVASAISALTYLSFISDGTTWTGYAVPASTGTGAVVQASSPTITTPTVSGNITQSSATGTLLLKQGANGKCGTFVANGITPVTITNSSIAITDTIIISLNTVGGTVGVQPHVATITASTGFTVICTATDTSTYNYAIISNAA